MPFSEKALQRQAVLCPANRIGIFEVSVFRIIAIELEPDLEAPGSEIRFWTDVIASEEMMVEAAVAITSLTPSLRSE